MALWLEKLNSVAQAVTTLWARAESASETPQVVATSESGRRYDSYMNELLQSFEIFGVANDYLTAVNDCKRLSETNPIFSGIMDKVVGPVAEHESYVKVDKIAGNENHPKRKIIEKDLNKLIEVVDWNEHKDEYLRNMLNEGGLSCELVADNTGMIRGLEYRPHHSIVPMLVNGKIVDPDYAYEQVDVYSREKVADFAKWQIAEVNWKESWYHRRGIPYLMASRRMLSSVGDMINGAVSKWMRSGGEIEVFNLKNAKAWTDVDAFKTNNAADLTPNTKRLIRQIFTKGDVEVDRLHGDNMADSTAVIEFLLELIFMSTSVSKEVMGFKGDLVIKDMANLSLDSYYRLLNRVQSRGHKVLKRACDLQMLIWNQKYGVLPEEVEYEIVGGVFQTETTQTKVDTTIKVVELLNNLMGEVKNKQTVLEQIVSLLTYDLKDYGITFKEELIYQPPPEPLMPGQRPTQTAKKKPVKKGGK